MKKRVNKIMAKGSSDAGLSTMELVVYLAIVAIILAGGAVAMYFTLNANAQENNASSAGLAAHTAIQAAFADYGTMPADAAAVDTYLSSTGDNTPGQILPPSTTIEVFILGTPSNNTLTEIVSTEFDDIIQIDGTGRVMKFPSGATTATHPEFVDTTALTPDYSW